jgi:hypothetical protein
VKRHAGWTAANAVMLVVFVASALLQLNDPDPFSWVAIYAAAAVMCGLEITRRLRPTYPALLALTALVWAATIAPRVLGKVPFGDMFAEFEMRDLGVEQSREMYGLVIVAVWMAALALAARKRFPRSERS